MTIAPNNPSARSLAYLKSAAALLALVSAASSQAATINWVGDTDNDFMNGANWAGDVLPSLSADTWQINGTGTQGNSNLNVSAPLTFTGNGGKIAFDVAFPTGGLSGSILTFFNNTSDAIGVSLNNANTITIANNIVVGDGSASGPTHPSFTSRNTTGGLLRFTGNITGGTGGTPGALALSLGSTATHNGNYEFTGNLTRGGATSLQLTKRGTGTATLTGTNVLLNLGNNEADSTIRINGGQTNILNAAGGGFGVANQATSVIRVSAGVLNAFDARNVRNSILIDGGTFNIGQANNESGLLQSNNAASGARFSFNGGTGAPAYTFTLSSGTVNFLPAGGGNNFGVRFGNDSGPSLSGTETTEATVTGTQSGGTFIINGRGTQDTTFSLGTATANKSNTYTLSGGVLDVRGSNSTDGAISLGANASSGSAVFTLSGTGKLISRSNPATSNSGIAGRQAGAVQVLALDGGTLVAGRIDAANLRGTLGGANGTLINNGTNISPGDVGFSGRTSIAGGLTINSGSMSFDLGGTSASTVFQDAASSGRYDNINVLSGAVNLGGNLSVAFIDGFLPSVSNSFTLLSAPSVSGTFVNAATSYTVDVSGTLYNFDVAYNPANVTLTLASIAAIPEPASFAALAGLGALGLGAARRRRRA